MLKNLKLTNMRKKNNYLIWKEIEDQKSIANTIVEKFLSIEKELRKFFKDYERLFFLGCGSSYHVGIIGNFLHDFLTDKKSYYVHSSDFMFFPDPCIASNSLSKIGLTNLVIQSG